MLLSITARFIAVPETHVPNSTRSSQDINLRDRNEEHDMVSAVRDCNYVETFDSCTEKLRNKENATG